VRFYPATVLLIILLLTASPVYADEAEDYINGQISEWTHLAATNGYDVLGTYTGLIGNTNVVYSFDLGPGLYHFWASGGMNISDLDCYAYDQDGIEIGSDTESDKVPVVILNLEDRTVIDFESSAWAFNEGHSEGYFCLVVASGNDGEIFSFTGQDIEDFVEPDDDYYRLEIELILDGWIQYEDEFGNDVYGSGIVLTDFDTLTVVEVFDPGFYQVYAEPDSRCIDLDMTVYGPDDESLAEDHLADNLPICEFMILEQGDIYIDLEVFELAEGQMETYVGYVILRLGGTSKNERMKYIEDKLLALEETYIYEDTVVYDTGYYEISESENVVTFEFELEPGSYFSEAQGGVAVTNLDMYAYDESGELLSEDTLDDNFPIIDFEIYELQTVEIVIEVVAFAPGFEEDFFAWVFTDSQNYYDDYYYDDHMEYDDESLLIELESASSMWNKVIESHGEEVVDSFTESITLGVDEETWSMEYAFDEGEYFLYVQGDGLCLADTDLFIYGDGEEALFQDALPDNSPMLKLTVGPEGAVYTIEVLAYSLWCDKGFFNLTITKPGVVFDDPLGFIENELNEWKMTAEGQDLNVLGEYVGTVYAGFEDGVICPGLETWTMVLMPGFYTFYSSGGAAVEDLDLSIFTLEGKPLGSDTRGDNIPMVRVLLTETTMVEIQFTACTYTAGNEEGYFCLVVASDSDGEILDFEGGAL